MSTPSAAPPLFVVPRWRGLPTGGNVYNEGLLQALLARGLAFERCEIDQLATTFMQGGFGWVWLDSLYFEQLPEVRARLPQASRLGLLLHALPSSLAEAEGRAHESVSCSRADAPASTALRERRELGLLDCAMSTSCTTEALLRERVPGLCTWTVEPAIRRAPSTARSAEPPLSALMIANLTPNKGVLPWLRALAQRVRADDDFSLRCLGRFDLEPAYARACQQELAQSPLLAARVELTGLASEAQVLEQLARAHVLISASRFESFGMAIADARASGCLVIARAGGHVAQLVEAPAGGVIVSDDQALADAFLALLRDPGDLRERLACAARNARQERTWDDAARDFLAHTRAHDVGRNAQ